MSNEVQIGALSLKFLVDETTSGGALVMFEMKVPEKARVPAPHHHRDFDEVVYGLEGTLTLTIDGVAHEVRPGDGVFTKRGLVHHFQNNHSGDARVLAVMTPGSAGKGYFDELAAVVNAGGPPDMSKVKEVMLRHGLVPA
jgi:quercetin dioxygenase-like cupin family protein